MKKKITILVVLVSMAAIMMLSAKVEPAKAATRNITLYGRGLGSPTGWGFTPETIANPGAAISVDQGDLVVLTLISQDGLAHQFLVDYNGNNVADVGEPASGIFSGTTTYQFTADSNGTFPYICTLHPTTMRGGFTVVPEFPVVILLPILIMSTLLAAIAMRKTSTANLQTLNS